MLDPDPHWNQCGSASPWFETWNGFVMCRKEYLHAFLTGRVQGNGWPSEKIPKLSVYALCVYQLMVAEGWGERGVPLCESRVRFFCVHNNPIYSIPWRVSLNWRLRMRRIWLSDWQYIWITDSAWHRVSCVQSRSEYSVSLKGQSPRAIHDSFLLKWVILYMYTLQWPRHHSLEI